MKTNSLFALLFSAAIVTFAYSCNDGGADKSSETDKKDTIVQSSKLIEPMLMGKVGDKEVHRYTLTNKNGMSVRIMNYGGYVTNIMVPDKNGEMGDVVLGFDSLPGYLQPGNPFMGCLVGRYANRIANGKFTLNGKEYTLAKNNNGNSLHGGLKGFDKAVWDATPVGDSGLKLSYTSKDMEEGYPGTLKTEVTYTLTDDNALKIEYKASTDQPTPVNLTNHTYFNLSAGKDSTILDHEIMLNADKYTAVNDKLIPTGKNPAVANTAMDFTSPHKIGERIAKVPGAKEPGGYDHNWVLRKDCGALALIGTAYHTASGRLMEIYTTQPGVQFYTGNFLTGSLKGKNGHTYVKNAGFCLETQHFPDSPNQPAFPSTILKPGETYEQTTIYKFATK